MTVISYAQNLEDVVLWRALSDVETGFYVDVGAYDPVEDSVTKLFHDRGWRGINVEPVKACFDRLLAARPRDLNLNAAVAPAPGRVVLHRIEGTGLSTIVEGIAAGHRTAGWDSQPVEVPALALADILARAGGEVIHFLKLDIEGAEEAVLTATDFSAIRPWIVVVEATLPLSQVESHAVWHAHLQAQGYEFVYFDGLNRFYLAAEQAERRTRFGAPPNVFDAYKTARVAGLEAELAARDAEVARLRAEVTSLRGELCGAQSRATRLRDAAVRLRARLRERDAAALRREEEIRALERCVEAGSRALFDADTAREMGLRGTRAEMARLQAEVARLRDEITRADAAHDALLCSTSWRVTAPLRAARTLAGALRGRRPGIGAAGPPAARPSPVPGPAGPDGDAPLDLWDDGAVAAASGQPAEVIAWTPDPPESAPDARSAARLILDLLRRRPDLRARFPRALNEGEGGRFAAWLAADGAAQLGLAPGTPAIRDAFRADLGARARQVALYDEALREREPLFLLPQGRRALTEALFGAVAAGDLAREEVWWLLLEAAEDPGRELVLTWQFTPRWQERCPDGTTMFGRERLAAWLSAVHRLDPGLADPEGWPLLDRPAEQVRLAYLARPAWRARFPGALTQAEEARALLAHLASGEAALSPAAARWCAGLDAERVAGELVRPGLNVLGHFSYPSGLRTSAESLVAGLHAQGWGTSLRDVRVDRRTDEPVHHRYAGPELFDATLIHVQPEPFFGAAYARAGLQPRRPRTYRIGYWYWEFGQVPAAWDEAVAACDELWTATTFIAEGLRARTDKPVHTFLPGLELPPLPPGSRSRYGLPEGSFVFAFTFHMTSIMERKNPIGLIEAFRRAFGPGDDVLLVVKTAFGARHPGELARLHAAAEGARVRIIDEVFSQEDTLGLMAVADAYVSLHRSEGLGLTLAEAMLLGKPVIATGYSGNMDFMDASTGLFVDHTLVALERDIPPYAAGLTWAEPDLDHAAALMRQLYEDRALSAALGARAKADLEGRLSYAQAGRPVAERLAAIARMRGRT